jgi:hypothetical protein
MKCSALTLYRNPCKNKDVGENGLCKKHAIIESNAKQKRKGKCVYIRRNNERCLKNAYIDGVDKDYCVEHSLYVLSSKMTCCKCCILLYMNTQQEQLGGHDIEIYDDNL